MILPPSADIPRLRNRVNDDLSVLEVDRDPYISRISTNHMDNSDVTSKLYRAKVKVKSGKQENSHRIKDTFVSPPAFSKRKSKSRQGERKTRPYSFHHEVTPFDGRLVFQLVRQTMRRNSYVERLQ